MQETHFKEHLILKACPVLLRNIVFTAVVISSFFLISCRPKTENGSAEYPEKIRLSEQYGLAYAPVAAARFQGWFEEELPEAEFRWLTMGNATAIREAMLAKRLDGGFMGIPPYLIGKDRGMEWTAFAAVSEADLGLACIRAGIDEISDIGPNLRIAVPQPGSIQHILLAMAAERELGDAGIFDSQLVTLNHPDGMNALLSGSEIEAHFTSPPFLQRELDGGAHLIIDGDEAFGGDYTFIVAVLSDSFTNSYPDAAGAIKKAIIRGADWIEANPGDAATLLAEHYHMEKGDLEAFFLSGALDFGEDIKGMIGFRDFMSEMAYLKGEIEDDDLILR